MTHTKRRSRPVPRGVLEMLEQDEEVLDLVLQLVDLLARRRSRLKKKARRTIYSK